jgi:mannose-6-phosphate isomerase-like protein (cupin superfamily)
MRTRVFEYPRHASRNTAGEANGYVVSLYKDWEGDFRAEPRQVYLNVTYPGERKGPHLHMERWDYFATIRGSMRFVIKYGEDEYEEVDVSARDGIRVVEVPPGVACLMINTGADEAWVINMPNPAWHPDRPDDNPVSYRAGF